MQTLFGPNPASLSLSVKCSHCAVSELATLDKTMMAAVGSSKMLPQILSLLRFRHTAVFVYSLLSSNACEYLRAMTLPALRHVVLFYFLKKLGFFCSAREELGHHKH